MEVRFANINDVPLILSFIQKKSEFDREIGAFSGEIKVSEAKIARTIFGRIPFAYVLFASNLESQDYSAALRIESPLSVGEIGFALYCFRYSSFAGQPSLWLDDLYVNEKMRSQGAGTALINRLVEIAKENDCTHLAWTADSRNTRGLKFYHRLGATITKQENNRCFFRYQIS